MSRNYYLLNNYSPYGKIGISHRAFTRIAEIATNHVAGAAITSKKKAAIFQMTNPVKVYFRKDGKVDIQLDVSIKKGESVKNVCLDIQNNVADAIVMMCEAVPFNVHIKVSSII